MTTSKRQLKGRVIFVRIKKKISKAAKKVLLFPFKGIKRSAGDDGDQLSIMDGSVGYVVSLPKSPASMSVLSVSSSILTGNDGAAHRIIGAVPPRNECPTGGHQLLYGAISYTRSGEEGSAADESDALPPAPTGGLLALPGPSGRALSCRCRADPLVCHR